MFFTNIILLLQNGKRIFLFVFILIHGKYKVLNSYIYEKHSNIYRFDRFLVLYVTSLLPNSDNSIFYSFFNLIKNNFIPK